MPDRTPKDRCLRYIRYAVCGVLISLMSFEGLAMTESKNVFNDPQVTPIAEAIFRGDIAQIQQLASEKILQQRGDQSITLLQWAILNQRPESLAALLELHADPFQPGLQGNSALHTAASVKDAHYLQILLDGRLKPNVRNSITSATPLAAAVMAGREVQVMMLLAAGADPNLPDRLGDTPLHLAGKINAPELALRLLQAGANAELRNKQGANFQQYFAMTPLKLQTNEMQRKYQELNEWLRANKQAELYLKQS